MIPDLPDNTGAPSQDGAPVFLSRRRVVFDTNVLLSLFVFVDSRYAPLRQRVESGDWLAFTSDACFAEFHRVIARPMFGLDAPAQVQASDSWDRLAQRVSVEALAESDVRPLPRCKDREDQKFLELARAAAADWLVTNDKALLKLARRDRLRGLFRILTPEAALAES